MFASSIFILLWQCCLAATIILLIPENEKQRQKLCFSSVMRRNQTSQANVYINWRKVVDIPIHSLSVLVI
ncbi:MAG: hypothetical protein ACFCU5_01255, partial [Pleurocapsa sp.]